MGRFVSQRWQIRAFYTLFVAGLLTLCQSLILFQTGGDFQVKINLAMQMALITNFEWWLYLASGSFLSPPFLFALAIVFWHSTFLIGYFFALAPIFNYSGNVFAIGYSDLPQATALVGLCLCCAVFGSLWGARKVTRTPNRRAAEWGSKLSLLSWGILLIFLALCAAFVIFEGTSNFDATYSSLYTTNLPNSLLGRIFQATKFFCVVAILAVLASVKSSRQFGLALGMTFLLIFLNLLMGSRSMPFIYGLALIVGVDAFFRRFSLPEMGAIAVGGSAASFIIDQTRVHGLGFHIFDFSSTGRSIDLWHVLWNSGGTITTVLRTIEFSASSGLLWGRSFLDAVIYLFPRAIVDGLGFRTGFVPPSEWLASMSPDIGVGAGLGYSLVAESYLNFSWYGCLIFLAIGWFLSWHYFKAIRGEDKFSMVHAYNIATLYALHMRNDAGSYLRAMVYGFLLVEAMKNLNSRNSIAPPI